MAETEFRNKCLILADLWLEYRDDEDWDDYIKFNDLGLPLAYMIANGIVEEKDSIIGHNFVNEAFNLLLVGLGLQDEGFELLDDVLQTAENIDTSKFEETSDDDDSQDSDIKEDEEDEEDEWDRGWNVGYESGIQSEQRRIQELCETYTEMYLEMGKGTKAVHWREVSDALKPIQKIDSNSDEDDDF
jgi:hypothetical protein